MIKIIGGTYREINYDTNTHNIYGSGLRAVSFFLENTKKEIFFNTIGNKQTENYLTNFQLYENFKFKVEKSENLLTFKYYFALDHPNIYPNVHILNSKPVASVCEGNVLCFGMLDGDFKIDAEKVVYDPQTAFNPCIFSKNSTADKLIYILNFSEAKCISNHTDIANIVRFFFESEKVEALIIKDGPNGAKIFLTQEESYDIPAYKTKQVNKIGSGDIFTAAFAYYWFECSQLSLTECAFFASKSTSIFCDTERYIDCTRNQEPFIYEEFTPTNLKDKQVYIAAPIFSLSDITLIDKIRDSLLQFGVKVFSPYHDVGYGKEKQIAELDIEGINNSDVIFSVLDGLDSGTLIELGYAMAKDKKIIGYNRTASEGSLLMLKLAKIEYYDELTTALYHTIWSM